VAVLPSRGCHSALRVVPIAGFGNYIEVNGLGVRASCQEGRGVGWYLTAGWGRRQRFESDPIDYATPVGILALYTFSHRFLPVIVAQVGVGMTGQPYELFTFSRRHIVPVHLTFLHKGVLIGGLAGGGAAFHGQGLFCTARRGKLVITQVFWDGPGGNAPMVHDKGGGITPAGTDTVTAYRERWTLTGQPLTERSVVELPTRQMTYRAANALENAHCP